MRTELAQSKQSRHQMLLPSAGLHHKLLGWYDLAKRAMPWRETRDPYAIWLSETMLQQTQVETVKPYYRKFLERFPTVGELAKADLQEVLALWAGLGYYRRAKHLHLAAREMVEKHGGRVPATFEGLISLPGVGRYTAGAVGSIAFGLPVAVVDGNVMRVISRLTGFDGDIGEAKNAGFFWGVMEGILEGLGSRGEGEESRGKGINQGGRVGDLGVKRGANGTVSGRFGTALGRFCAGLEGAGTGLDGVSAGGSGAEGRVEGAGGGARYGDLNQAVMELGATVCTPAPGRPGCLVCPVRGWCRALEEGRVMELPVKRKKGEVAEVRGVAVVVVRRKEQEARSKKGEAGNKKGEEVLLMQRPMGGVWEGMWEFPVVGAGGGREPQSHRDTEDAQRKNKRRKDYVDRSRLELHLDTSIKNGLGFWGAGKKKTGEERAVGGEGGKAGFRLNVLEERGSVMGRELVGEEMMGVLAGMGLGAVRVVRCGEVRHQLTHRLMVFEVVRVEVVGEGTEALRQGGTKGGTRNAKRLEGVEALRHGGTEGGMREIVLPGSVTAGGGRYVGFCWVGWPLVEGGVGGLPLAKVVWKVGAAAAE